MISNDLLPRGTSWGVLPVSCQEHLEVSISWRFNITWAGNLFIYTLRTVTICCYQLSDITVDLSKPITGNEAFHYWTSSVIGGGPIYSALLFNEWTWPIGGVALERVYNRGTYCLVYFCKTELLLVPFLIL